MGHGTCFLKPAATHGGPTMRLSRAPPVKNLRAFCVAARQLSFKFAADELCLTPSAVSHQMRELETVLGLRLFERRTRALELTAAGLRLLGEVEPLLEGLDRALAQLARGDGRETLRVRAPALFANELLIPRLEDFCAAHPSIDVQLDTRDPRPVESLEQWLDLAQQSQARRRQLESPRAPLEQSPAEYRLELFHLVADRRGGQAKLVSRKLEAQLPRGDAERPQVLHGRSSGEAHRRTTLELLPA